MSNELRWKLRFLHMAKLVSTWSKDPSTQVGACIVDAHNRVVSLGFNGFPRQMTDFEELYSDREQKYSRIIHAEVNALIFARGVIPPGSTLYTYPFMPCDRCVVMMLQAGIMRYIAPKATPSAEERWGSAFVKTRTYCHEVGALIEECNFE